ncbi:MAG: hypothetical protein AAB546_03655, partial [Patescibacteria group bacterium]
MCNSIPWDKIAIFIFIACEIVWFSILVGVVILVFKKIKSVLLKTISFALLLCFWVFTALVGFFAFLIITEIHGQPVGSEYFTLNAAIKNTCYLDPERLHCPKTLDELISIEDRKFKKYLIDSSLYYEYRPETHEYTLIALKKNSERGVIFDPRFISKVNP